MTLEEMLSTYVRLTADLYQQLENEQVEHNKTKAELERERATE